MAARFSTITRRQVLAATVGAASALTLAACGAVPAAPPAEAPETEGKPAPKAAAPPETGVREITISNYHSPEDARWKALSETYRIGEEALGIKINTTPEYREVNTKRATEWAAGTATVDITYNQLNWFLPWGLSGMLVDLNPYFSKGPRKKEDYFTTDLEAWGWGGKLYALTFQFGGECFMFNRQLFDKAGLNYPTKDWTYDDLLEMGRKLTNPDEKRWAVRVAQNHIFYMHGTYVLNFGGPLLDEKKEKALFGEDPGAIAGTQYNVDLHLKHQFTPPAELREQLPQGQSYLEAGFVAMEDNGIFRHNTIRKFLGESLDFAPPPKGVNQRAAVLGNAYSILSLSKVQDLAWDFLMWLHSEQGFLETPQFGAIAWPPVITYARHPKWLEPFKGTQVLDAVDVWESGGHTSGVLPERGEVLKVARAEMGRMIKGETTVPEGLRTMGDQMNSILAQRPPEWRQ